VRTGGDARNRRHLEGRVVVGDGVPAAVEALAYDPQTSGGLLAAVAADRLPLDGFTVVGEAVEGVPRVELR
jgi:hypothetical protein